MKNVVTLQAEKQVYLEAQLVVEIPDGIEIDEGKIQLLCDQPIMDFVYGHGVDWEEIDSEWPQVTGIDSVEASDDQDDVADIRLVQTKDGSLIPSGNDGKNCVVARDAADDVCAT